MDAVAQGGYRMGMGASRAPSGFLVGGLLAVWRFLDRHVRQPERAWHLARRGVVMERDMARLDSSVRQPPDRQPQRASSASAPVGHPMEKSQCVGRRGGHPRVEPSLVDRAGSDPMGYLGQGSGVCPDPLADRLGAPSPAGALPGGDLRQRPRHALLSRDGCAFDMAGCRLAGRSGGGYCACGSDGLGMAPFGQDPYPPHMDVCGLGDDVAERGGGTSAGLPRAGLVGVAV